MDNNNNIDIKKRDKLRILKCAFIMLLASVISSVALHSFVYPANFVPLGMEAVATMLFYLFPKINAGYFNIILNVPLFVFAFFKLNKKYTFLTLAFTIVSSVILILLEKINFPQYKCEDSGRLLAAIFTGIMLGLRTGLMLRIGASTGGVDIVASFVQKKLPHLCVERIITVLCLGLIIVSYFVYNDFNSILLGIVQMFISEKATTFLLRDTRKAVRVEIITKHPEQIRNDIVVNLRHTATVTESTGMFSGEKYYVVLTILNLYQMSLFAEIMKKYPDAFATYSEVQGVLGNFRRYRDEEAK